MLVNRKYDRLVIVLLAVGLLAFAAYRPAFRLRSEMPPDFVDASDSWPLQKRVAEQRIAKAYWNLAFTEIQWKYGYGYRLPQDPPAEFTIASPGLEPAESDAATRARYWRRLRQVWPEPSTWNRRYVWDLSGVTNSLRSAGDWLTRQMQSLFGSW